MPESLAVEVLDEVIVNHSIECDMGADCSCQPVYGTRAQEPGPRGCWALKRDGHACGAARRSDGDYCNAHSGRGVAANPRELGVIGRRAAGEARTRRAALRTSLGITRPNSIRGTLKAHAYVERERIARAALAPLAPDRVAEDPVAAHRAALAVLDAVEPAQRVELVSELPSDPSTLTLAELEALEGAGLLELET